MKLYGYERAENGELRIVEKEVAPSSPEKLEETRRAILASGDEELIAAMRAMLDFHRKESEELFRLFTKP